MCQVSKRSILNRVKVVLVSIWLNIPLASCSLINVNFLLLHNAHNGNSIIFPLLDFETFGVSFYFLYLVDTSKSMITFIIIYLYLRSFHYFDVFVQFTIIKSSNRLFWTGWNLDKSASFYKYVLLWFTMMLPESSVRATKMFEFARPMLIWMNQEKVCYSFNLQKPFWRYSIAVVL